MTTLLIIYVKKTKRRTPEKMVIIVKNGPSNPGSTPE